MEIRSQERYIELGIWHAQIGIKLLDGDIILPTKVYDIKLEAIRHLQYAQVFLSRAKSWDECKKDIHWVTLMTRDNYCTTCGKRFP